MPLSHQDISRGAQMLLTVTVYFTSYLSGSVSRSFQKWNEWYSRLQSIVRAVHYPGSDNCMEFLLYRRKAVRSWSCTALSNSSVVSISDGILYVTTIQKEMGQPFNRLQLGTHANSHIWTHNYFRSSKLW